MTTVRIDLDQSAILSMVQTFTSQLTLAEEFAAKDIENKIRYLVFDDFVRSLCARAGTGWSEVYTDHLVYAMKALIPINTSASGGRVTVEYDLEALGDYSDLERGFHHRAIEAQEWSRHPSLVDLPYQGQPLATDSERRKEFWEQVVVGRDFSFELNLRRGAGFAIAADLGYVATFDEVAFARVSEGWGYTVAPEWLWLENGLDVAEPHINPVDFTRSLEVVTGCIAQRVYEGAILGLVRVAEAAGGSIAVGSRGRLYRASGPLGGTTVKYRAEIDSSTDDIYGCFGSI